MTTLIQYIEALTRPTRVVVIESEVEIAQQISGALSVYSCNTTILTPPIIHPGLVLNVGAGLVFLADDIPGRITSLAVLHLLETQSPVASVVILTRTPSSEKVAALMKYGPYTFMVKNGSFTEKHIKRVFCQLNLRLRASGQPEASTNNVCPQPV